MKTGIAGRHTIKLTPKQKRIIEAAADLWDNDSWGANITYSHSTMCQTSLPFKDMGKKNVWVSTNGHNNIMVEAGKVLHPETKEVIQLGLPYGAKPRLILLFINQIAMLTQSPEIDLEKSLHGFIQRVGIERHPSGKTYQAVKDQLTRLAASKLHIGYREKDGSMTMQKRDIVKDMNVFFTTDEGQSLLWSRSIKLSDEYYDGLVNHAVPLDEKALYMLKDSAIELDIYAMLAERLHRIKIGKPQFIPWTYLHQQYGIGYTRIRDFRKKFLTHLKNVHAVYPYAQIEETTNSNGRSKGLTLCNSLPPIQKR